MPKVSPADFADPPSEDKYVKKGDICMNPTAVCSECIFNVRQHLAWACLPHERLAKASHDELKVKAATA